MITLTITSIVIDVNQDYGSVTELDAMRDVIYLVKLDAQMWDRLRSLVEGSGLTAKEFLERLVDSYEANQTRESMKQLKEIGDLHHGSPSEGNARRPFRESLLHLGILMHEYSIALTPYEIQLFRFLRALTRGEHAALLRGLAAAAEDSRQAAGKCDPKSDRAREYVDKELLMEGLGELILSLGTDRERVT